jgi:small conductance mechanosensitive channel
VRMSLGSHNSRGRLPGFAGGWGGRLILISLVCLAVFSAPALAQTPPTPTPPGPSDEVDVEPTAQDAQIAERLTGILEATGWFVNPQVQVEEGVVFLDGQAQTTEFKNWAGDLARRTQDVVAVVNRMEVTQTSIWNFSPAMTRLRELGRSAVQVFPVLLFSLVILIIAVSAAYGTTVVARKSLRRRYLNRLLVNVIARGAGLLVLLVGLYVVFQVAGLTSVALTVVGGTGLLGLILGIAFQDITENFLASIFLSLQSPFLAGDLVEIEGVLGYVQMLTTRTTVLMTLDGNHVQIPNATVFKAKIHNYTSNPNRRLDFVVGIGYGDSTTAAQELALQVLADHPAVLKDPEPLVLVESLGAAAVNLRVFFWIDGTQYSWQKVRSSVIRLVKRAFQAAEIAMPGEVREVVFPEGIPIQELEAGRIAPRPGTARQAIPSPAEEPDTVSTDAEAGLVSEAGEIEEQARQSRSPEEGENLLEAPDDE